MLPHRDTLPLYIPTCMHMTCRAGYGASRDRTEVHYRKIHTTGQDVSCARRTVQMQESNMPITLQETG